MTKSLAYQSRMNDGGCLGMTYAAVRGGNEVGDRMRGKEEKSSFSRRTSTLSKFKLLFNE